MVRHRPHTAVCSLPGQSESAAGVAEQVIHHDAVEVRCQIEPLDPASAFADSGAELFRPHRMLVSLSDGEQIARLNGLVEWEGLRLRIRAWQHHRARTATAHTALTLEAERRQPVAGDR